MKRAILTLFVVSIFALSFGLVSSFAAEEGSHMEGSHMDAGMANVAIDGHCPVCIIGGKVVDGNKNFATEYKGNK